MAIPQDQVQEMQGLYGPFTIAERVVQKIWLRRDFATERAVLADGTRLGVRSPGTWNLLDGPDFRGARLGLNGREVTGDVEVHFHASDWRAHGHASDPAYDHVVLHLVMFPPGEGEAPATRRDGSVIPTLVLLPLLHRSLEEYASDDALENITAQDVVGRIAALAAMPPMEVRQLLQHQAAARWRQKVHFASLRLGRLGWVDAAHHTALEILGYRHNRAEMLAVAGRHPLGEWTDRLDVDGIMRDRVGHWQLHGVRPANGPRLRLQQYQRWVAQRGHWPELLGKALPESWVSPDVATPVGQARKQAALATLRTKLARDVVAEAVGGSRLDTLICDGFLPLLAATTGRDLYGCWFHWYLGDCPAGMRQSLAVLGLAAQPGRPYCHGWAQGLLGWMVEREARASG